jgi:hypothetical protein
LFPCFKYDIKEAEGDVWLSGSPSHSEKDRRSPLAFPFLSFTDRMADPNIKYIVFKADPTGEAGYGTDLIAGVPVGRNVRTSPSGNPSTGWWWPSDAVDALTVAIVED